MPVELQPVEPVAAICAIMGTSEQMLITAEERLVEFLGPISRRSRTYPFDLSAYYHGEMGTELLKRLVCFRQRVDPAALATLKGDTMALERTLAWMDGSVQRRRVNVDPGLISVDSLVLATTKYSGHRICIAPQLFAEVTLLFRKGACVAFEWTYPDYRTALVHEFLLAVRAQLLHERRQQRALEHLT